VPHTSVTACDFEPLELPLTEPFAVAQGAPEVAENVLVRVQLAGGIHGLGEAAPFTAVSGETQASTLAALARLRDVVVGKKAKDIPRELAALEPEAPSARAAIEMAVLDGLAKAADLPLWRYFGGRGSELRTDMTVTAGDVEHAKSSALAIVRRGISVIKVKVGAADPDRDIERLAAIRAAAPKARLVVDANGGFDLAGARRFLDGLRRHGVVIELFEQPLPRGPLEPWRELAAIAPMPLCADESARSATEVRSLARAGAARSVNIKVMKSGVAEARAMITAAKELGMSLMIGGMVESILAMSFSAHLAAGEGGFTHVDLDTPMFVARHPFAGGYAQTGEVLKLGHVRAGHGVELAAR
jgi:L-Ala-D/L-Glu epimerase